MFGKLPSKRDFVSYNMTRPFLDRWEEWLQATVAASRLALGERWQESFLGVPIWRFWFGADVFGQQVTGAFMPSVDGVGRYFPLSVCACATEEIRLVPPPAVELDRWHENCEQFLLAMLDDQPAGDAATVLSSLPFAPFSAEPWQEPLGHNPMVWMASPGSLGKAFASLKVMNDVACHGRRGYMWTVGGGSHQACLIAREGGPGQDFMTEMLTGKFAS